MTRTRWEQVGQLRGRGILVCGGTGETIQVDYRLEVTQEYLVSSRGQDIPRQKNIKGYISPTPDWSLNVEHSLQLANGQSIKCWLHNRQGRVVCQD